ncbi:MAG: hypothetical protein HUJ31_08370, partial [Pseudomonadales bacterium]|nr:hypothetical protein [Pseudomonadales bacterium]
SGTVTDVSGTFTNIESITGGSGADTFSIGGSGSLAGSVDGGGGTDTLVQTSGTNTFSITGSNAGSVTDVTGGFSSVENLTGGSGADTFDFADGSSLSGAVDGGGGSDILDVADVLAATNITISADGTSGLAGSISSTNVTITGGFDNIDSLVASNGSGGTLTGSAGSDTFTTSGTDAGTLTSTQSTTYANFTSLAGGSGTDTFNIGHDVTGSIDGGAGTDTVNIVAAHNAGTSFDVTAEILDDTGTNTVSATSVVLDGVTSVGQIGDRIDINANALTITNGAGDIYLSESDSIEITSASSGVGAFDLTAGTDVTIGSISSTGSTVTVNSSGGSINDATDDATTDISAGGLISLTAQDEVGGLPVAGTTTDSSGAIELSAGSSVDVSSTTAGGIVLFGQGALTLVDVDTVDGSILVTAVGDITATDVIVGDSGLSGTDDLILTSTGGSISVGAVTAIDQAELDANVAITDATANDAVADVTAPIVSLGTAGGGIGQDANGDLDTDADTLAISATGGGVDVRDVGDGVSIGVVTLTGGGSVTGAIADTGDLEITADSPLTIDSAVSQTGGGNIVLAAEGNTTADDLTINANVTASGGD